MRLLACLCVSALLCLSVVSAAAQVHVSHSTRVDAALPGTLYAGSPNSVKLMGRRLDRASFYILLPQNAKYTKFPVTAPLNAEIVAKLKEIQGIYCRAVDQCIVGIMPPGNSRVTSERFVGIDLPAETQTGQYWLLILDDGRNLLGSIPVGVTGADPSSSGSLTPRTQALPEGLRPCPTVGSVQQGSTPASDPKSADAICNTSFLSYEETKDNFGSHVANTYYALQIGVANNNSRYDFMLRNITLLLPDGRRVSSRVKRFAQGVAISGKVHDRRNLAVNSLQWGGSIFGGITTFEFIATDAKNAANIFQGLFMDGLRQTFPDTSVENVNRFNNAVFDDQQPTIVPRGGGGKSAAYVIALVPRPQGDHVATDYLGQQIASAIEGEFIQTAQLVELSPKQITFQKPHTVVAAIGDTPAADDEVLPFSIRNNSGSTLHIVSITSDHPKDFGIVPETCVAKNADGLPNLAQPSFDLASDSQCGSKVFFEPSVSGDVTGNIVVTTSTDVYKIPLTGTGLIAQIQLAVPASPSSSNQPLADGPNYIYPAVAGNVPTLQALVSTSQKLKSINGAKIESSAGTVTPNTINITDDTHPGTAVISGIPLPGNTTVDIQLLGASGGSIALKRSLTLKQTDLPYPCVVKGGGCASAPFTDSPGYTVTIHPSASNPATVKLSDTDIANGFSLSLNADARASCVAAGNIVTVPTTNDCTIVLGYVVPAGTSTPPSATVQLSIKGDLIYSLPFIPTLPTPAVVSFGNTLSLAGGGTLTINGTNLMQVQQISINGLTTTLSVDIDKGGSDNSVTTTKITSDLLKQHGAESGQTYPVSIVLKSPANKTIDTGKRVSVVP